MLALTNSVPGPQTAYFDTYQFGNYSVSQPIAFTPAQGNGISVSHTTLGTNPLNVTLSVDAGFLTLVHPNPNGGIVYRTGDGYQDSTIVFEGTLADVNTALSWVGYTPPAEQFFQWTVANGGNDHWYQFVSGNKTWTQARDEATDAGGYLATVTSAAESTFVNALVYDPAVSFWLGGYQDRTSVTYSEPAGGWRWVTSEPWSYTNWNAGDPNNAGGTEDHLAGNWSSSGKWADLQATNARPGYIVEFETDPRPAPRPQATLTLTTDDLGFAGPRLTDTDTVTINLARQPGFAESPNYSTNPAAVDTTFGTNGVVTVDASAGSIDSVIDMRVMPDDKIVAVGAVNNRVGLLRFNADGTLDTTFGPNGDGGVQVDLGNGVLPIEMQIDLNGRIVVLAPQNIVRFTAQGLLDGTWGTGGLVALQGTDVIRARSLQVTAENTYLLSVEDRFAKFGHFQIYGPNGSVIADLDGNFVSSNADLERTALIAADGSVLVIGLAKRDGFGPWTALGIERYRPANTSFQLTTGSRPDLGLSFEIRSAINLPDGRVLIVGSSNSDFFVARLLQDGRLDTTFGTNGVSRVNVLNATDEGWRATVAADGKILVTGYGFNGVNNDVCVIRMSYDGVLDTSFGSAGLRWLNLGGDDRGNAVATLPDGKILIGGQTGNDIAFVRLLGDAINPNGPSDIGLSAAPVLESAAINTVIGTLTATDSTPGDTFTFSLVPGTGSADNGLFRVSGNQLLVNGPLDFETKSLLSVRIRTTDADGLWFEKVFSIAVNDTLEPPAVPAEQGTTRLSDGLLNAVEAAAGTTIRVGLGTSGAASGDTIELLLGGLAFATPKTVTLSATNVTNGYVDFTVSGADLGADGAKSLTATARNTIGASTPSGPLAFTLDTTAPLAPATPVEQGTTNLADNLLNAAEAATATTVRVGLGTSGATSGDIVELLRGGLVFATPKTVTLSATDITNGYVDFSVLGADLGADGSKSLTAIVRDAAGNAGPASSQLAFTMDTTAPTPPAAPVEQGSSKLSDGVLNATESSTATTFRVSLGSSNAVAGDTLELLLNGAPFATRKTFTLTSTEMTNRYVDFTVTPAEIGADSPKSLTARVIDAAGNPGVAGAPLAFVKDTVAATSPSAPIEQGSAKLGDGWLNATEAATATTVRVGLGTSGAIEGDRVDLLLNSAAFSTPKNRVLSAGDITAGYVDFSVLLTDLGVDGAKSITATVSDFYGTSSPTTALTFTLDTVPRSAPATPAEQGSTKLADSFLNAAEAATATTIRVGIGPSGAAIGDTVELLLGGAAFAPAKTKTLNATDITAGYVDFPVSTTDLGADGVKSITARVTDVAGNPSVASLPITFTKDLVAPNAPAAPTSSTLADGWLNAAEAATATTIRVSIGPSGAASGDTVELLLGGSAFVPAKTVRLTVTNVSDGFVDFTVLGADLGADGSKSLTARVTDEAGNPGSASPPLTFTKDASTPTVSSVVATGTGITAGSGALRAGATVTLTVNTTKAVTIAGGSPTLSLSSGGTAAYFSGSGTTALVFTYTVAAGENTSDLTVTALNANGATITDSAGNSLATFANNPAGTLVIDTTAPTVSSVAITSATGIQNQRLNAGDVVSVTVTFSEAVTVTGTPQVTIDVGGTNRTANYSSGSGSASIVFTYTIQSSDTDTNGIGIAANSLANAGGSTIADAAGNVAVLNHSAVADNPAYLVDNTAPTVSSVAITSATGIQNQRLNAGDVVSVTVTFGEAVTITGTPQLTLDVGGANRAANYASGSGSTAIVFTYTIQAGDTDTNGIGITGNSLLLNGGAITDLAGNAAVLTHSAVPDNPNYLVDTTAPLAPLTPIEQASSKLADGYLDFVELLTPTSFRVGLGTSGAVVGDTVELLLGGLPFAPAKSVVLTAGNITAGFIDFSVTSLDLGADGNKSLTARVTDLAGNVGPESAAVTFTKDTVSPVPREIGTTKLADGNYNIADAATETTIRVYLANSGAVVGDVLRLLVNNTPIKTVTLNVAHIFDGYVDFVVTAAGLGVDGAKTISSQLTKGVTPGPNNIAISFIKDTVAPNAPAIPTEPPTPSSPTKLIDGKLNLVEYGSSTAIRIRLAGTTAVAGDVVSLLLNDSAFIPAKNLTLTGTDITAGYVDFVVQAPDLGLDGLKAISALITDAVGNVGPASVSMVFELDTALPAAPSSPLEVGTTKFADGWFNATEAATSTTVRVSIVGAEVNDALELLVNGSPFSTAKIAPITAVEISQGFVLFTVSSADLGGDGLKALSARIIDQSGNVSNSGTAPLSFTKDTTAPSAPATPAETGNTKLADNFANAAELAAPIVLRVNLGASGAVVGDTITLLLGGVGFTPAKNVVLTPLDLSNGFVDFSVSASDLAADGDKSITARVTDAAGNQGVASVTALTFKKDTASPAAPNAPVEMGTGKLTDGKYGTGDSLSDTIFRVPLGVSGAVAGDRVELLLNGVSFAPASLQNPVTLGAVDVSNGYVEFTLTSANLGADGPKALSARVVDQAGNPGSPSGSLPFVKDTASPPTPFAPVEQATAKLADGNLNFADAATATWIRVGLSGTGAITGDEVELLVNGIAFATPKKVTLSPANAIDGFVDFLVTTADLGADGIKAVAARLTDVNGASVVSAALTFVKDTQAPTAPAQPAEAGSTKLADGKLNLIEAASQTTIRVTLSGTGAIAGDTLTLRLSPISGSWPRTVVLSGTDIANDRVDFVISNADLGVDGFKSLSADITDAVGNVGPASPALVFEKDTLVPTAPAAPSETGTPKVGDGFLNATEEPAGMTVRVTLGPTVRANDSIELMLGGSPFSTPKTAVLSPVDISAGFVDFAVSAGDLGADGSKAIASRITDQSGNVGPASPALAFVKDIAAPTATAKPAEQFTTNLQDNILKVTEAGTSSVIRVNLSTSGAVIGDTLELLLNGAAFAPAKTRLLTALNISDAFVDFVVSTAELGADGTKSITARVTDTAGNAGTVSSTLAFVKDTTAPAAPGVPTEQGSSKLSDSRLNAVEAATATTFRVSLGSSGAIAGDTVDLLLGGVAFGTPKTAVLAGTDITNGYVDFTVSGTDLGADGAKSLTARLTDRNTAGPESTALAFTKDIVAPNAPATPTEQGSTKLSDNVLNLTEATTSTTFRVTLGSSGAVVNDTLELLLENASFATPKTATLTAANVTNGYVDFTVSGADLGSDGSKSLTAKVTDAAGNPGPTGLGITFAKDTAAPAVASVAITSATGILNQQLNAGDVVNVTVTFSEAVTVTGTPQLTLNVGGSNRTASYSSGSGSTGIVFTYTIQPGDSDTNGISIAANSLANAGGSSIADAAGNAAGLTHSAVADNPAYLVDTTAPMATIASSKATLKSGETATITFTLSEPSTTFAAGDVTVTGGTLSGFAGSGTSYSATFTPTASAGASGTVSVAAGTFTDAAGNNNTAGSLTPAIVIDTVAPTVTIASSKSSLRSGETATITFTLSEAATNFTSSDVTVTGGTLSGFSGSGANYTATFTPAANSTASGTIAVAANTFTDAAGNDNTAGSLSPSISIDTVAPTVAISSSTSSLRSGETATISFTLSEPSTNFASSDVTVTGGTLSSFSGSGSSYSATFTPTANSTANGTVSVAAGRFTDAAGNDNTAGTLAPVISVDTVAPTVAVSSSKATLKSGETATITFTLSEPSTTFAAGDVSVTGGTLSGFAGSGTSYSATFTPTASAGASGTVSVAAGTFTDAAGNTNTAGSLTPAIVIDTVAPSLTIASSKSSLRSGETATITFTLSEAATNFTSSDVTVTGGTLSGFSGSGTNYTATFTPAANSTASGTIAVAANTFTDAAGNDNTAGSLAPAISIDTVAPTVTISSSTSSLRSGETATISFTLSEPSTNFASSDVTVTGGTLSGFSGSGTSYSATFTPAANSTANGTVSVAAGRFTDAAGNDNTAGTLAPVISVDTVAPTVAIASSNATLRSGESATITFTLSELSTTFDAGDVTVTGGTLSDFTGSDASYSATFTPTAGATAPGTVAVAAGTFSDLAGNGNLAGTMNPSITIDTVAPTVASLTGVSANGRYGASQPVSFAVNFSEPVVVTGTPLITLNTAPARTARYVSGSGTNSLVFQYLSVLGDVSSRLNQASRNALTLNGGSIRDELGNDANRTLPALSAETALAGSSNIVIDALLQASVSGLGTSLATAPTVNRSLTTFNIAFSAPVRGVTLASFRLFFQNRSVSLAGAVVRQSNASGTLWTLTLPSKATSLRGNYRLDIGGPTSGITSGSVGMTNVRSVFWRRA